MDAFSFLTVSKGWFCVRVRLTKFVTDPSHASFVRFSILLRMRDRYPNSDVDVLVPSRGKGAYELNPNVRNVFVQELDDFSRPDETTALTGKLRNNNYQKLISAKPAGASFSLQMLATVIPDRISYISREGYVFNWIASLVMKGERVPKMKMATFGASMYDLLWKIALEEEAPKAKKLNFTIPQKATAHAKEILAGLDIMPQSYVLVQTSPQPDMDTSSEPLDWTNFGSDPKMPVLFVTKTSAEAKAHPNNKAVAVPSTADLAALIEMSAGVVCGNTPALQLGTALGKPVVLVSKSDDIADAFVPGHAVASVRTPEAAESIALSWLS